MSCSFIFSLIHVDAWCFRLIAFAILHSSLQFCIGWFLTPYYVLLSRFMLFCFMQNLQLDVNFFVVFIVFVSGNALVSKLVFVSVVGFNRCVSVL